MNIRGVTLRLSGYMTDSDFLSLFHGVDIDGLIFKNIPEEFDYFYLKEMPEPEYEKKAQNAADFFKDDICILFMKLLAAKNKDAFSDDCYTYDEFKNSRLEMVMLICDENELDIYIKNPEDAKTICRNAEKTRFEDMYLITDENDPRTALSNG